MPCRISKQLVDQSMKFWCTRRSGLNAESRYVTDVPLLSLQPLQHPRGFSLPGSRDGCGVLHDVYVLLSAEHVNKRNEEDGEKAKDDVNRQNRAVV